MMDAEQGRCRRTDGKKWRCYKAVVPDQKYCEKHMHRGSKRSRKLVESENTPVVLIRKSQPTTLGLTTTSAKGDDKAESNDAGKHNMVVKKRIAVELPFSPKSVLQDGQSCSKVEYHTKNPQQTSSRCNRTDSRKWQCNNQALPAHKYCAQHINRGLKKPVNSLLATKEAKTRHFTSSTTNLDILLSMSLPDPRSNFRDTACDSTSTETTVSDDGANISNLH